MRFLHTSDWHLGRSLHRENLLPAQRAFLDHLVRTVEAEGIDAVLVAGDVHDRAVPSLGAVELFDEVLHKLAALGVPVVLISGNHDSAQRLGIGAGLIARAGVHLRTDPDAVGEPVLLRDEHGEVAVYGLPYLEPALVGRRVGAEEVSHAAVLGAAMDAVRADLAGRRQADSNCRSVVLAHAFVIGGEVSDSERDISVGGVPSVPASVFDGVDYAALGHLHGCQTVNERVRYSGSPLAYSFSEADRRKSMWLVDLGADGEVTARRIDCPVPRRLVRLRGELHELLTSPDHDDVEDCWVQATLTDAARPAQAMEKLRQRFPHTLQLAFEPENRADDGLASYGARVRGRDDGAVALGFVRHVRGSVASEAESALLVAAVEAAARTEGDD
ncbi:exonuclease SbcCD subunit D [Streptacidiphilus fuscans]|uniref:Nuclease SbcCD subunit D n=1 Tax=Streptacidiphilus fuscans TaxID=2789292 RepID=A0A931FGW3_9ACTN|nr:exonuclease SbcCD subunit D [Streptacidiphilus fuscans]MBF9071675.1 exonuclease SbcCD subunit D [Streptacidiphilus fuscans]